MTHLTSRTKTKFLSWVIALGAMLLIAFVVHSVLSFWPRVTAENYARIEVGMSMADIERMLGKLEFDTTEYGVIGEEGDYVINFGLSDQEKLDMGYRKYRRLTWTSTEITIVVVFDSNGLVATRYSTEAE